MDLYHLFYRQGWLDIFTHTYLCIYIYNVCMYVYMYLCMCVCMFVCLCVYVCIYVCIYYVMYLYKCMHSCVMCGCMCVFVYLYRCMYVYSFTSMYSCFYAYIYIYIHTYRVSQEERTKLREGVPYVKLYRYNPRHLCPKLNGYWDNGQIKLWTSFGSTNDSCQLVSFICICSPVRHTNCWRSPEMHIPAYVRQADRQVGWRHRSAFQCDV